MDVMDQSVGAVPPENIHVPVEEFVDVWTKAEALSDGKTLQGMGVWYLAGVAITCRWLARATVRAPGGPWEPAPGPASGQMSAHPGNIDAEAEAIEAAAATSVPEDDDDLTPEGAALVGMRAAFAWAWSRTAPAPGGLDTVEQWLGEKEWQAVQSVLR